MVVLIVLLVIAFVVLLTLARTVRIVPQANAGLIERLGRYNRTLDAGITIVVPFVDRLRPLIDLREQVVSFDPQPVITEDTSSSASTPSSTSRSPTRRRRRTRSRTTSRQSSS